jgi:hypothetical protein
MFTINMFFHLMKHFEFIRFINKFRSNTRISKRVLLKNIVRKKHNIVRQKILQDMKSNTKINFAINNSTNSNNFAFMKIIDYFIDHEWRFRKILLVFKYFLNLHIDKTMFRKIMNIFKNYELKRRLLNLKQMIMCRIMIKCEDLFEKYFWRIISNEIIKRIMFHV